jgi:predicted transcriptional regulator
MNLNIYIEDQLAEKLSQYAEKSKRKKNAIIREAIKNWLQLHVKKKWSNEIVKFNGIEDFPNVKELRKGLIDSDKKLF